MDSIFCYFYFITNGMAKFLFFDCLKKSNKEWHNLRFSAKAFEDLG